jgi:hypothetical protein
MFPASTGAAALAFLAASSDRLSLAAIVLCTAVVAICGTIIVLSRMNRRPPRVDLGSFHLRFDDEEDPDA